MNARLISFIISTALFSTSVLPDPQIKLPLSEASQKVSQLPEKTLDFLRRHAAFIWSLRQSPDSEETRSDWKTALARLEYEKEGLEEHYENLHTLLNIPRYIYIPAWASSIAITMGSAFFPEKHEQLEEALKLIFAVLALATPAAEIIRWGILKRMQHTINQKGHEINATKVKMYEEATR